MQLGEAVNLLAGSDLTSLGPTIWADLGCGTGIFTLALAECLAAGSTIHALDRDRAALRSLPPEHHDVRVVPHRGDFSNAAWPFAGLDGILMANSLHYVKDQSPFIHACEAHLRSRRFLIVEYDTDAANRWVPYPLSRSALTALFRDAGYSSIAFLGSRPSVYRRAALYGALITK